MTRILIVNGEHAAADEFSGFCRQGYAITTCKSVIAATALVEEIRPRVVFTDISLRGAKDFLSWLRRTTGCASVAITNGNEENDIPSWVCDATVPTGACYAELTRVIDDLGLTLDESAKNEIVDDEMVCLIEDRPDFVVPVADDSELSLLASLPSRGANDFRIIGQEVIALWGAKGGDGRTTVALMLAQALQDFETVLIDLNFRDGPGDINIALDLPAIPHLGRLLDEQTDRRKGFMESLIKPKKWGFAVIQPPPTIDQADQITPDDIIDLIDQARRVFQVVIIDLPADLSPLTLEAVDLSTTILFVATTHAGGLARLELLKSYVRKDIARSLVLNRFKSSAGRAREISHFLDMPLAAAIPEAEFLKNYEEKGQLPRKYDNVIHQRINDILKLVFGIDACLPENRSVISRLFKGA